MLLSVLKENLNETISKRIESSLKKFKETKIRDAAVEELIDNVISELWVTAPPKDTLAKVSKKWWTNDEDAPGRKAKWPIL